MLGPGLKWLGGLRLVLEIVVGLQGFSCVVGLGVLVDFAGVFLPSSLYISGSLGQKDMVTIVTALMICCWCLVGGLALEERCLCWVRLAYVCLV